MSELNNNSVHAVLRDLERRRDLLQRMIDQLREEYRLDVGAPAMAHDAAGKPLADKRSESTDANITEGWGIKGGLDAEM